MPKLRPVPLPRSTGPPVPEPVRACAAALRSGAALPDAFAKLVPEDAAETARALGEVAHHPGLRPEWDLWLPELLLSAHPGSGARSLAELADALPEVTGQPLRLAELPCLPSVLGASPFLQRALRRHPEWALDLASARGEGVPGAPDGHPDASFASIRATKYRGLLRVVARDLAGARPYERSLEELSELADRCLAAGLIAAAEQTGQEPPSVLALGKLGGRELNFSSDVDLLFVFDTPDTEAGLARYEAMVPLIRAFKSGLEESTADGFGYRVDLEIRPEGREGPLANSIQGALGYYESFGMEWERQALVRVRHVAGPREPAEAFVAGILPFVYRRHLSADVLDSVRAMKQRIEDERRASRRNLEYELKEGPGGIRDVEFLVQAFQLLCGGDAPVLRTGNVTHALRTLAEGAWLPEDVCADLEDAYLWLRRAEHGIQLEEERQTQRFPDREAAQRRLARILGHREPDLDQARDALLRRWRSVRDRVRAHFEAALPDDEARPSRRGRVVSVLRGTPLAARVNPVLSALDEIPDAESWLESLPDDRLGGLIRAVAGRSDALRDLALRPELGPPPGHEGEGEATLAIEAEPGDLEGLLDALRITRRTRSLRCAVDLFAGSAPFEDVSHRLSETAELVVQEALGAARQRAPEDLALSVIAMGKLGSREFTFESDLDLIFLHEGDAHEAHEASRVTQRLIHYLTTMTATGIAYAVDSRLRPSGNQGTLVSSFDAYRRYQSENAATWEHIALVRARPIAGAIELGRSCLGDIQAETLGRGPERWPDVALMRGRVEKERGQESGDQLAWKTGAGGLMDVEFLAQGAALELGLPSEGPPSIPNLLRDLAPGPATEALLEDYGLIRLFEATVRWVVGRPLESIARGDAHLPAVASLIEADLPAEALLQRVDAARGRIRVAFSRVSEAGRIAALVE